MVQDHKIYCAGCGDLFSVGNEVALDNPDRTACCCTCYALLGEIQN